MRPPLGSFEKKPALDTFFSQTGDQPFEVTQKYGESSPYEPQSGGVNYGTDLATPVGTPITLPKGNYEVISTYDQADPQGGNLNNWENQGYGNSVLLINKDTGQFARYSHLSDVHVAPGEFQGGTIGKTGASGHITGAHVDIEAYDKEGNQTDPEQTPFTKVFTKPIEKPLGVPEGQQAPQQPPISQFSQPQAAESLDQNYYADGTPDNLKPLIDKASKDSGIPTHILSSQIKAESNFDPNAQSAYASGLAQFTPETAKARGVNPSDPASAISGMAAYDREIMDKHGGNTDLALGGYNAGPGAVEDGQLPNYPETLQYVDRINKYAQDATASAKPKTQDLLGKKKPPAKQKNFFQSLLGL